MIDLMFDAILQDTEHAYLIEFEEDVEVWVPKSHSSMEHGYISVKQWLVDKHELEYYER